MKAFNIDLWYYILMSISWWQYVILGCAIACIVVYFVLDNGKALRISNPKLKKRVDSDAVIGYKTANIGLLNIDESNNITDLKLRGLLGKPYSVTDVTKNRGKEKFNMYSSVDNALSHDQNNGAVFLEVLGFGDLEEQDRGYFAEKQRVLQVGFINCSYLHNNRFRCDNTPQYIVDGLKVKGVFCSGCISNIDTNTAKIIPLQEFYYREMTLNSGETIVVTGPSSRNSIDFEPTVIGEEKESIND